MNLKLIGKFIHKINPLHIYCRLGNIIGRRLAKMVAYSYEKTIYNTFLHKLIVTEISYIQRKEERKKVISSGSSRKNQRY